MEKPVIIFDADPIVYRIGFACQKTVDGEVIAEPEAYACQTAKQVIKETIRKVKKKMWQDDMDVEFYLSSPKNFRHDIATIKPYKGNRKAEKPVHYQTIRDYLVDVWGAEVIHQWEADDEVSIRARECSDNDIPYCVATIDKDLDQIPGPHYDYRQHVFYMIDEEYAERFFWKQCLTGDATDNIQGCYRLGDKIAEVLLDELDPIDWGDVVNQYEITLAKFPDKYPEDMTAEEAALETARLVKMMEYRGQLWTPDGEPDETIE